jgi:carbon-monoxide dehydrogenase iron sulfur subunit
VKRIVADVTKCLGCRSCELACALAHSGTDDLVEALYARRSRPRLYVECALGKAVPLQCRHCEDAPCVRVCPSGALTRPDQNGPVVVRQEKCIGCSYCVQACPFGVIRLVERPGETGSARKAVHRCDLCAERRERGLEPACVVACPVAALSFEEVDESARRTRSKAALAAVAASEECR